MKRIKWLLSQINLLVLNFSKIEKQAWEGFSVEATEYDKEYRVFSMDQVVLKKPGDSTRICLKRLDNGKVVQEACFESGTPEVIGIKEHNKGETLVYAKAEGEAWVTCTWNHKTYGILLQVGEKGAEGINYFYKMATVPWKSARNFFYRPNKGKAAGLGFGIYYFLKDTWYYGVPYTNRTLAKKEFLLEQFQMTGVEGDVLSEISDQDGCICNMDYPGNDCSTALGRAWNMEMWGQEDRSFFEKEELEYPSTYTICALPARKEVTGKEYAVDSVVELRFNLKQGCDTRKQVKKLSDRNRVYHKLEAGDGVLRYYRTALLRSGHVMLVRYHDKVNKRIYFMDQHSVPKKGRPWKQGHSILPGQSTCSTWYSMTYDELMKNGYLPIWLAGKQK